EQPTGLELACGTYDDVSVLDMWNGTATSIWDEIVSITPAGEEEVFDLTVPGPASWLADGIVSHNSGALEQDADVVMFVYRPAMYDKTDENENMAEIIVAKQRNGPTDTINLTFLRDQTRFASMDRRHGGEPFAAPAGLEEPYA
ncbi:MAG TPA: DnaB-like helicase C-terminal domain-containing protein, partial [Candidatus Eisenbacteria bacterium]